MAASKILDAWRSIPRFRQLVSWTAVIAWAALIFSLSSISKFPIHPKTQLVPDTVHVIEYGVLTFLLIGALRSLALPWRRALWWAAVLALLYGISDEFHQSFVPNRTPSVLDLLIDAAAITGVILAVRARQRSAAATGGRVAPRP